MAVGMTLRSGDGPGPQDEHPARLDHLGHFRAISVERYWFPGERGVRIGRKLRARGRDSIFYLFDGLIAPDQVVKFVQYRPLIRTTHRIHLLIPSVWGGRPCNLRLLTAWLLS